MLRAEEVLPYVPYFPAGWNPRPWHDLRPCYQLPNREKWKQALDQVNNDLEQQPKLGLPGQILSTIYS